MQNQKGAKEHSTQAQSPESLAEQEEGQKRERDVKGAKYVEKKLDDKWKKEKRRDEKEVERKEEKAAETKLRIIGKSFNAQQQKRFLFSFLVTVVR